MSGQVVRDIMQANKNNTIGDHERKGAEFTNYL